MQTALHEQVRHEEMVPGHMYEIEDDRGGIIQGNYDQRSDSMITLKNTMYIMPSGYHMPYPSWCVSIHRIVSCKKFHF